MAELNDDIHNQILEEGKTTFPWESYRRLLAQGTAPEVALKMLGWTGPLPTA